jgi:chemotaxis response regulator CheB
MSCSVQPLEPQGAMLSASSRLEWVMMARGGCWKCSGQSVNIAEHESTAVVFGMPKEAIARGAASIVAPFPKIVGEILAITSKRRR